MPVQKGDLTIYQGDDYTAQVYVSQEGIPPGSVLTGYTAKAQIRDGYADDNPVVVVEIATAVLSPYINLTIPKTLTLDLEGEYRWDLQVTSASGGVTTILYGSATVLKEVTR
jgi:hypothetical protein